MTELTVASFNTHWGFDVRGRPYDVVTPVAALDADVLVVQEAWHPHGREAAVDAIARTMGMHLEEVTFTTDHYRGRPRRVTVPDGPPGTVGLAVLSRLPVEATMAVPLPRTRSDVVEQRRALLLTVRVDDRRIAIGGVHASHRLWGSLPQLRVLDRELRATGLPSVLVGDCNMWGPPIAAAVRNRTPAVRGRTWPARFPHSQIDHILVDDRIEVLDGGVGPAVGSDHRPVRARLRLR